MILELLNKSQKVLILGFAREGQSTYRFLRKYYPHLEIIIADQKSPEKLPDDFSGQTFFGNNYLNSLATGDWRLVIKSPGISPHKQEIADAIESGIVFSSHTQIFFEKCLGKTIGVTGTKGKSTTASLIHHVLTTNDIKSVLLGNIGKPALDYLEEITPDTWVVMELSSYQLMDLSSSPHIAILQNIFPDHLDYHLDFNEYANAKSNIFKYQTPDDYLIYNADNKNCRDLVLKIKNLKLKIVPFSLADYDINIKTALVGNHNKYNILPAVVIGKLLRIPQEKIYSAIAIFQPLDTRLQLVGTANGVRFFADTLATIPEATIAAIDALGSDVETLIAGGHDRKQNYSDLAKKILSTNINTLVLFPDTGARIESEINQTQKKDLKIYHVENMPDAVKLALDHTASGKICLLSPAAPSFTLFKDYRDEHEQYKNEITSHLLDHSSAN